MASPVKTKMADSLKFKMASFVNTKMKAPVREAKKSFFFDQDDLNNSEVPLENNSEHNLNKFNGVESRKDVIAKGIKQDFLCIKLIFKNVSSSISH
jgi:hypothetical protein